MRLRTVAAMLVSAGLMAAAPVTFSAEGAKKEDIKKTGAAPKVGEQEWIKKAAEGGMAEVEMGKLAAEKAKSPEVKKFGEHMVQDHSKANKKLMGIAKDKGVTPPKQLSAKHQAKMKELKQADGAKFDQMYMETQLEGHQEMIALFEKGAKNSDGDVKEFATETLPTIKEHYQMAQTVSGKSPR